MGGGAIRTAAKAAAFAGYRSTAPRRPPTLPSVASASATFHVASDGETVPLVSTMSSENIVAVQRPGWELDDWEFADMDLDLMPHVDPKPRLVFGPAPSTEEAEEATNDLKEAIDNIYFAGTAEDNVKVSQMSDLGGSTAILPSLPKPVVQAFTMLQGSPEAQSVVASLASDPNVWEAFLKNEKVVEFYLKHQPVTRPKDFEPEAVGENESSIESSETVDSPPNNGNSETGPEYFTDFVQNIKVKVSEMVSNISSFLQDFMGASFESHGEVGPKTATSTVDNCSDVAFGASFIALAVAAILVILVKRG